MRIMGEKEKPDFMHKWVEGETAPGMPCVICGHPWIQHGADRCMLCETEKKERDQRGTLRRTHRLRVRYNHNPTRYIYARPTNKILNLQRQADHYRELAKTGGDTKVAKHLQQNGCYTEVHLQVWTGEKWMDVGAPFHIVYEPKRLQ